MAKSKEFHRTSKPGQMIEHAILNLIYVENVSMRLTYSKGHFLK
jgi:hypothetical protein